VAQTSSAVSCGLREIQAVPHNLLHYVIFEWDNLEDAERQHSIEVLAGWINSLAKQEILSVKRGYFSEDLVAGIAAEIALELGQIGSDNFPFIIYQVDYLKDYLFCCASEQIMTAKGVFAGLCMERVELWCRKLAKAVLNSMRRALADRGFHKRVSLPPEVEGEDLPPAQWHSLDINDPGLIENIVALKDAERLVEERLQILTSREKDVMGLRIFEEMTQKEIATELGIGFESVNTLVDKARQRLLKRIPH